MGVGSLGKDESRNLAQKNSRSEEKHDAVRAENDQESESEIEDEHEARRHVRPMRRKYNIFRQTRPRGSNPNRAIALVRHFGHQYGSNGLMIQLECS